MTTTKDVSTKEFELKKSTNRDVVGIPKKPTHKTKRQICKCENALYKMIDMIRLISLSLGLFRVSAN